VLQALANREQVEDVNRFLLASLKRRAASNAASGAGTAAPATTSPIAAKTLDKDAIRKQIEYYFSDAKYPNLKSKADPNGWIRLAVFLPFNTLQGLGVKTVDQMVKAIQGSSSVVVHSDMQRIQRKFPLAAGQAATMRSAAAQQIGGSPPKVPAGKAHIGKAPIGKSPGAKSTIVKAPAAKSAVTKSAASTALPAARAPKAKARAAAPSGPGSGKPPQPRTDLEFEEMMLQSKLIAMNKQGIWPATHPLDEATLAWVLKMGDPQRAMEILDEAEQEGAELEDPAAWVQSKVRTEAML